MKPAYDYNRSPAKPNTLRSLDVETSIAVITFERGKDEPTSVIWAQLDPNDAVTHGCIKIDPYHPERAANEINRLLAGAIVRREHFVGPSSAERFFDRAGVMPAWNRLEGLGDGIDEALSIRLAGGCSFRPQYPAPVAGPPLAKALEWIAHVSSIRRFSRAVGAIANLMP